VGHRSDLGSLSPGAEIVRTTCVSSRSGEVGQTLGFALAKGLVRGLTRCPNPPSRFYSTTHFWINVGESVLCLTVDTSHALDPVHMGVVWDGQS